MWGKQPNRNTLEPPPIAQTNSDAVEVLRVWAAPGSPQQLTLRTTWKDSGAWGLVLVDIARHAARAYANEGQDLQVVLARIRELFETEWSQPTDASKDITPSRMCGFGLTISVERTMRTLCVFQGLQNAAHAKR
jgi:hypothetical protein